MTVTYNQASKIAGLSWIVFCISFALEPINELWAGSISDIAGLIFAISAYYAFKKGNKNEFYNDVINSKKLNLVSLITSILGIAVAYISESKMIYFWAIILIAELAVLLFPQKFSKTK